MAMSKIKKPVQQQDFMTYIDELDANAKRNLLIKLKIENEQLRGENIIKIISEHSEPLINLIRETSEKWLQFRQTSVSFGLRMSSFVVIIVLSIIGMAGTLTYLDKIDGSTFTFLLGLITGYVLTFIRDSINYDS